MILVSQLHTKCYESLYKQELPHTGNVCHNILPELSEVLMWFFVDGYNDTGSFDAMSARTIFKCYLPSTDNRIIEKSLLDVFKTVKKEMFLPNKRHIINYTVDKNILKYKIIFVERINGTKYLHMPDEIIVDVR